MGQNYLITGGSSGIGLACAIRLASEDNTIIIVGRNEERLNNVQAMLPGKTVCIKYDLEDIENISEIYRIIEDHGIKLDGLIYSAGIDATFPVKANQADLMQRIMKVNCISFVEMCKYFYSKRISNDCSSIVAISSIASLTNDKGMVAYSASKAALNSTVVTISKEFVRRNIRVNAVLPSGVNTEMAAKKVEMITGMSNLEQKDPLQPLGIIQPDKIANIVEYLLSDSSIYMTGELITISAGRPF